MQGLPQPLSSAGIRHMGRKVPRRGFINQRRVLCSLLRLSVCFTAYKMIDHFSYYAWIWHNMFFVCLCHLCAYSSSSQCLRFAASMALINQAAWQENVRNGWAGVWGEAMGVWWREREPVVAQLWVARGSVSRDNCRYQPAPISLMCTCDIMATALSQRGKQKGETRKCQHRSSRRTLDCLSWTLYFLIFQCPTSM